MSDIDPAAQPDLSAENDACHGGAQRDRRAYEAERIAAGKMDAATGRVVDFDAVRAWADTIDTVRERPPPLMR